MPPILLIPGYRGSGPGHWQTLWEASLPGARRVEMPGWDRPERGPWVAALDAAVAACAEAPVLVAHSLGCIAAVRWALGSRRKVRGALLVAPCDPDRPSLPDALASFAPAPLEKLSFPALVVASSDDPYCSLERALSFAHGWGAALHHAGACGHINVDAGYGDWPEGLSLLREVS